MSRKNIVGCELDPQRPSSLGPEERRKLEALRETPDEQIDTSDIPHLSEAFWKNAVRNPFFRPVKRQITVRLDADVLEWLRSSGRGYQSKLNEILREAMLRELRQR